MALQRRLGHADCGIYAEVIAGGAIAKGDASDRARHSRRCCRTGRLIHACHARAGLRSLPARSASNTRIPVDTVRGPLKPKSTIPTEKPLRKLSRNETTGPTELDTTRYRWGLARAAQENQRRDAVPHGSSNLGTRIGLWLRPALDFIHCNR